MPPQVDNVDVASTLPSSSSGSSSDEATPQDVGTIGATYIPEAPLEVATGGTPTAAHGATATNGEALSSIFGANSWRVPAPP